jgi:C1A family cysteine protease
VPRGGISGRCGLTPVNLSARTSYSSGGAASFWDHVHKDKSVNAIQLYLGMNLPILLTFNVTDAFRNVTSMGYVAYSSADSLTSNGSHIVHIVGYITNSDLESKMSVPPGSGGGYFIVKNSWGAWFGDAGYVYLPVDYVKANATAVSFASM